MWIDKTAYTDLVKREAESRTKIEEMARVQAALFTMNDWLRIRTEALERNNAILIETYMGVKMEVARTRPVEEFQVRASEIGGATIFEDMGDEAAKVMGVEWTPDGTLKGR